VSFIVARGGSKEEKRREAQKAEREGGQEVGTAASEGQVYIQGECEDMVLFLF
jgi:hypothetical protein